MIYFNQATTSEGKLFKDFVLSPKTGFVTVALNGTVDISEIKLAVNFYGGKSDHANVQGELRIGLSNKVWAHPFTIATNRGNKGVGAESVLRNNIAPNAAWIIIDPMKVIGAR